MPKPIDLTGQYFGYWKVIERFANTEGRCTKWLCECKCGTRKVVNGATLRNGTSKSCGCMRTELLIGRVRTHGKRKTRFYRIWAQMIQRTTNKNQKDYDYYGERGIAVCKEWRESFDTFEQWAKENGYAENLTIDRKDNNKGYEPGNCHWVTMKEQSRNTRRTHYLTYNGQTKPLTDWADEMQIPRFVLDTRINKLGWSVEKALTTKVKNANRPCYLTLNGITKTITEWANETGIPKGTLRHRINILGWSVEKALTTKVRQQSNNIKK